MMQCCSQVVTQLPQVINPAVLVAILAGITALVSGIGNKGQGKK